MKKQKLTRTAARRQGKPFPCWCCHKKRVLSASGLCRECGQRRMTKNFGKILQGKQT